MGLQFPVCACYKILAHKQFKISAQIEGLLGGVVSGENRFDFATHEHEKKNKHKNAGVD
jgi:preprotein translocase subunit Sec63